MAPIYVHELKRLMPSGVLLDNMTDGAEEWEGFIDHSAPVTNDDIETEGVSDSGDLVEMAESWYESISKEEVRHRMIRNYILGVTTDNIGIEEANEIMRAHGFDV